MTKIYFRDTLSDQALEVTEANPLPVSSSLSGVAADEVQGNVAHDAADAGNPVKVGGRARSTSITPVASDDRVDAIYNLLGALTISPGSGVMAAPNATNPAALTDLAGNTRPLAVVVMPSGLNGVTPLNSTSVAEEASRIAKATAGNLYGFTAYNNNAAARFIQLFDSATLPADAVVPALTYPIAIGATLSVDFGSYGRRFANGIVICNSTTDTTKTIGTADSLFDVNYA